MDKKKGNRKKIGIAFFLMLVLILSLFLYVIANPKKEDSVYKETAVTFGDLAVGITESGNVEIGTIEQKFTLDISAFSGTSSSAKQNQNMFGNGFAFPNAGTNNASTSGTTDVETRTLEVEEVYMNVGQKITQGDPLFRLTTESVESIRSELVKDLEEAELSLTKLRAEEKTIKLSASHTQETNITYGSAAELEYKETANDLKDVLTQAAALLEEKEKELQAANEELLERQELYQEDKKLLEEAQYLLKVIDIEEGEDLYGYVKAENSREEIEEKVLKEEDELETSTEEIAKIEKEVSSLQTSLEEKQKEEEVGNIAAKKTYDTRMINSKNAEELYNIQTELSESDLQNAEYEYETAKKKKTDFDNYIVNGIVSSDYSGVITEISVVQGDTIENKQSLLSLNNYNEVSISVNIQEADLEQIKMGDEANVYIAAFPEENFIGKVTNIGEASVNTSTTVITYPVEVTISGEHLGIYEKMTGNVTFTTKEIKEVVQVNNRAIIREAGKSFVKVRDEAGEIKRKEVTTGFSDGICVEIVEGLSKGDVVLIESKVSEE